MYREPVCVQVSEPQLDKPVSPLLNTSISLKRLVRQVKQLTRRGWRLSSGRRHLSTITLPTRPSSSHYRPAAAASSAWLEHTSNPSAKLRSQLIFFIPESAIIWGTLFELKFYFFIFSIQASLANPVTNYSNVRLIRTAITIWTYIQYFTVNYTQIDPLRKYLY